MTTFKASCSMTIDWMFSLINTVVSVPSMDETCERKAAQIRFPTSRKKNITAATTLGAYYYFFGHYS